MALDSPIVRTTFTRNQQLADRFTAAGLPQLYDCPQVWGGNFIVDRTVRINRDVTDFPARTTGVFCDAVQLVALCARSGVAALLVAAAISRRRLRALSCCCLSRCQRRVLCSSSRCRGAAAALRRIAASPPPCAPCNRLVAAPMHAHVLHGMLAPRLNVSRQVLFGAGLVQWP